MKFCHEILETLSYHTMKTRSLYLCWFETVPGHDGRTDGRTDRQIERQKKTTTTYTSLVSWRDVKLLWHFVVWWQLRVSKLWMWMCCCSWTLLTHENSQAPSFAVICMHLSVDVLCLLTCFYVSFWVVSCCFIAGFRELYSRVDSNITSGKYVMCMAGRQFVKHACIDITWK